MGNFALSFLTLEPGEKVVVRRIEKPGYEVFNKEAVEQWNISTSTPFKIVMCRSDKFKSLKDLYYRNSEERYNKQYKQAVEELRQLREQNKILQQEYSERLKKIGEEYDKQLDNLDNYVDRFARIDLSELSANEQEIIDLVQQGEIDEAIKRYDELNASAKLISNIQSRKEVQSAISNLVGVDENLAQANDSLYAMVERQIQTLQLAGAEYNRKIQKLYCDVADADTTNILWLVKTGNYIKEYIADYNLSIHYLQKALNNVLRRYGSDRSYTATIYNQIGEAYYSLRLYPQALEYCNTALEIAKKTMNSDDFKFSFFYNNIGVIYQEINDYSTALEYFNKALSVIEKNYGPNHILSSNTYSNLGNLYLEQCDYDAAITYCKQALEIEETYYGADSPEVATSYNNLGQIYRQLGDLQMALEYSERSLYILEKKYGLTHPIVASLYNNIGAIAFYKGDNKKALEFFNKAQTIREVIFGKESLQVADSYNNIGSVYNAEKEYSKALEYDLKCIEIKEKNLGPNNQSVALSYNNIGLTYIHLRDYDKAIECLNKALNIREQILPSYHSEIANTYNNLGGLYFTKGDYPKALEYVKRAMQIREKIYSPDHSAVKAIYFAYVSILAKNVEINPIYKNEISEFLSDKMWIGLVLGEDSIAASKGLKGEYYVLEYEGWRYNKDYDLKTAIDGLNGKSKTIVLLQDNTITSYVFEDRVGINFMLKRISPEEKQLIDTLYNQWKANENQSL